MARNPEPGRYVLNRRQTTRLVLIAMFAALTAAGSWFKIPLPPVPVTMQTLFVTMAGDMLDWKGAFLSQLIFLIAGLCGLPVFAGGGGPGYVLNPTFGYLLGFLAAAPIIAVLVRRSVNGKWTSLILPNILGMAVVFIPGLLYLVLSMQYIVGTPLTLSQVLMSGLVLFLPGTVVKAVLAAWLSHTIKSRLNYA